jgi:hypothetical protein
MALWSAIALHAFRGMLGRMSKGLVGLDREEADMLVASAFLEALGRVRPARDPARIPMYVRQETWRAVMTELKRDARASHYRAGDEDDDWAAGSENDQTWDDEWLAGRPSHPPSRCVDPDTLADPASLVPIEDRLTIREPMAKSICDEDLLRAHALRGGLRRLTHCLLEDGTARQREHMYRQLIRRAQKIVARRK